MDDIIHMEMYLSQPKTTSQIKILEPNNLDSPREISKCKWTRLAREKKLGIIIQKISSNKNSKDGINWKETTDERKRDVNEFQNKGEKKIRLQKLVSASYTNNTAVGLASQTCRLP